MLAGPHKVSYRPGKKWDFEGCTDNAPIDLDLVMPPHRPRLQPENHRTGMFLSSESGPVRAKVVRALPALLALETFLTLWLTVPTCPEPFLPPCNCRRSKYRRDRMGSVELLGFHHCLRLACILLARLHRTRYAQRKLQPRSSACMDR